MHLLNERNQVRKVADRWLAQYGLYGSYGADNRRRSIGRKLLALDKETATAEDVAEIIGNTSWVCQQKCGECGTKSWNIVQVGEPLDYESATAYLCVNCLRAAVKLVEDEE